MYAAKSDHKKAGIRRSEEKENAVEMMTGNLTSVAIN
jgi:hypothetical protein